MVKDAPLGVFRKSGQNINIAVRPEIRTQGGPEEREFFDLPLATEAFDYVIRDL